MNYSTKIRRLNADYYPKRIFQGPEWIVMGVNNVCNLHCKMCDVGTKNLESNFAVNLIGTQPLNMPIELFKRIVDQAAEHYPKTKIGYAFTEPLVYPHLEESLKYAQSKGMYTSLTTNALTLKQKAKMLVESGLNDLFISLDGPEEIHNEIRGHSKSFQKAVEGIEEILRFPNPPKISIFCCITEWNIGHLERFLTFFQNYPLEQIGFMHTNFTPQAIADKHNLIYGETYRATDSNVDEVDLTNMDLDQLWDEIQRIESKKHLFDVRFSPSVKSRDELDTFYYRPEQLMGKKCMDVFSNVMIKSDGSCIPAHGRCYQVNTGNIYNSNLKEIWNSPAFSGFRKTLNSAGGLLPACSRCCSAFGK